MIYHFVRTDDDTFELQFCPTEIVEADLLTKTLSMARLGQHCRTLIDHSLILDKANSV